MIVQPETLLRWHRDFFRLVWRRKSKAESKPGRPPLSDDDIARIKRLARENATWGAERIRGELMHLGIEQGIRVSRGQQSRRPSAVSSRRARCSTGCITPIPGWQHKALGMVRPNALSITD
jgi:hypothetical protein